MTMRHAIATSRLLFVAITGFAAASAIAADFPNRPVRLLVPFVPGGAADIVGRMLAQKLSDGWGVPMVVDNRSGAAAISERAWSRARPLTATRS
jgi:tripartite-type tricarboxylate transporter receptor subunit TctC